MTDKDTLHAAIKPCPFCGDPDCEEAESAVPTLAGGKKRAVYCNACFCEGPTADSAAEAIAAWNARHAAAELVAAAPAVTLTDDCLLSWSGFNVKGDAKSINAVRDAIHHAGQVPEWKARVRELEAARATLAPTPPAAEPVAWHCPANNRNGPSLIYPATYAKLSEAARRDFQPLFAATPPAVAAAPSASGVLTDERDKSWQAWSTTTAALKENDRG